MKKLIYVLFSALLMSGCSSDSFEEDTPGIIEKLPVFTATMESTDSTRTYLEGNHIYWKEGDEISVFVKSTTNSEYVLSTGSGSNNATFKPKNAKPDPDPTPEGNNQFGIGQFEYDNTGAYAYTRASMALNGAVYPYSASNQVTDNGNGSLTFTFGIADKQTYTPGSFEPAQFPMIAVSDNENLQFKNICGMLKLQLRGNKKLSKIELRGNDNEALAGTAHSTMMIGSIPQTSWNDPAPGMNSVTLNCNNTQLTAAAQSFIMTLRPTVFKNGFRVMLTDSEGHKKVLRKSKNQPTINRNDMLTMPETLCEFTQTTLKAGSTIAWGFPANADVVFKSGQHSNLNGTDIADNGSIAAYIQGTNIRTAADEINLNADCSNMFQNAKGIASVKFDICNTSHVTNMSGMFKDCNNLTLADLSDFTTSAVNDFSYMFANVGTKTTEGTEIILGNDFSISMTKNIQNMFAGAKIKSIRCTPELKNFIQQNGEALGLTKGTITWYNYNTGEQGEISVTVEGTRQLIITHMLRNFTAPTLKGSIRNGSVIWDANGSETTFTNGASHEYKTEGEHKVTISARGTNGFEMNTLNGVKKIDISNFK